MRIILLPFTYKEIIKFKDTILNNLPLLFFLGLTSVGLYNSFTYLSLIHETYLILKKKGYCKTIFQKMEEENILCAHFLVMVIWQFPKNRIVPY